MGKQLPETVHPAAAAEGTASGAKNGTFVESVSASMRPVEGVISELSQSDVPVLLLAEDGAGKHATARRIHEMSRRSGQPFHSLQCSTLRPDDLPISYHNGGQNHGGTIFLDELADLSSASQAYLREALLRAAGRNGSSDTGPRFICGSARDLEVEVKAGRLREDLYYRISGVCLRLPPLRQRKEDIPSLMAHFLSKYAQEFRRPIPEVSSQMARLFEDYSWPGNLRELESAARVLVALGDEQLAMGGLRALLRQPSENGNGNRMSLKAAAKAASHQAEKELIRNTLKMVSGNREQAAKILGIGERTLYRKIKEYELAE